MTDHAALDEQGKRIAAWCRDLGKVYRSGMEAVKGVNLDVGVGEIVGLLGPNGAGKTTTMHMLAAVLPPSSGSATVLGYDVATEGTEVRRRIGVVPQANWFDTDLTAFENLVVFARYFGMSRAHARDRAFEALTFAQLDQRADAKVVELSGGMLRRLSIARALINEPDFIIMDEPTTGLDPQSRHALWGYLFELRAAGKAILLSTHYMEEAQSVCNRLYIMDHGTVLRQGSPESIVNEFEDRYTLTVTGSEDCIETARNTLAKAGALTEQLPGRLVAFVKDADVATELLLSVGALQDGCCVMTSRLMTLEDVFLRLTGRGLREA